MADAESVTVATPDTTTAAEDEPPLDLDRIFETLKNERRRLVLQYLHGVGSGVSLSELSEAIAAMENGKQVGEASTEERKRVYVGLYQCHLPMMDQAGVVEFDKSRGEVALGTHADELFPYLERSAETSPGVRWYLAYVGLSVGSLLLLGMVLVADLFGGVNVAVPALAVVVVSFALLSVAHARDIIARTDHERSSVDIHEAGSAKPSGRSP